MIRAQLPTLLKRLRQIEDPRNPNKLKHGLVSLMLYGMLVFVLHCSSRREANTEITRPQFEENLRLLFPELDSLPHADTLFRLLTKIDVSQIEQAHLELVARLIRKKKFAAYRIDNHYPIAIDGTQKLGSTRLWSESLQERRVAGADPDAPARYQYHVYVLEANLCFHNGMVIPLLSEFLDYQQGDTEEGKQDCELRAFQRLTARLKKAFPRLPVMLLLDGLYPNGPVVARCRAYHWQFMIVLKDDSLPSVWAEYHGLLRLQPDNEYRHRWGERDQHFRWVNDIRYEYGPNQRQHVTVHVVACAEQWQAVAEDGQIVTKTANHAWISSHKLRRDNVHQRCNLAARHRWGIESCILVEKHHGYRYEHLFAKHWNAMRGYHYLMRLAHLLNTLARFSTALAASHQTLGVRAFLRFVRDTYAGPWLDLDLVHQYLKRPFRLRFT
ncbi:MAG TPA: transposase family protein [Acidiferrobacterales bacterium]|nr:transposase family protein [Acidiferrobacterales bacterium]